MAMAAAGEHSGGRRRRVLFFPMPFQGHFGPMLRLAALLHSRGHAVTVFHTDFNAPDSSKYPPDYTFITVPADIPNAADASKSDIIAFILALNRTCAAPFEDRLKSLLAGDGGADVACLVVDAHWLSILRAAARHRLQTVVLRTGSAASFTVFVKYPALWDKYLPMPAAPEERDKLVSELPPHRVKDLLYVSWSDAGELRRLVANAVEAARGSAGVVINTFAALETPELQRLRNAFPGVPVFDIGPLGAAAAGEPSLLAADRSCIEWLDAQPPESVIYISFGSIAAMSAAEFTEAAWGISNSGCRFLWVLRPGLVNGSSGEAAVLPDGFAAATAGRGMTVRWAPQQEVLEHAAVGGFWTHCGWNSTMEAVSAGKPMLCSPFFADQSENSRYVEVVWEIGFELDAGEMERGKVEKGIKMLMVEEAGTAMRKKAKVLKEMAKASVAEGGSSAAGVRRLVDCIADAHRRRSE